MVLGAEPKREELVLRFDPIVDDRYTVYRCPLDSACEAVRDGDELVTDAKLATHLLLEVAKYDAEQNVQPVNPEGKINAVFPKRGNEPVYQEQNSFAEGASEDAGQKRVARTL